MKKDSKTSLLQSLKDFAAEAPVAAPITFVSYAAAAIGLICMFAAGPLSLPALGSAGVLLGVGGVLTCTTAMMGYLAVSIGRDLGVFRKPAKAQENTGNDNRRPNLSQAPSGPGLQAIPAAEAAFNKAGQGADVDNTAAAPAQDRATRGPGL